MSERFGRRSLLTSGAVVASTFAVASQAKGQEVETTTSPTATAIKSGGAQVAGDKPRLGDAMVPFDGKHQAGIETPHQSYLNLAGLNLKKGIKPAYLLNLMRVWSEDSRHLCTGEAPAGSLEKELEDSPANLTVTCGWGESFFEKAGIDKPQWLGDVRSYTRDKLEPQWGQTDLVLQICSDDPTTAAHALRHLLRAGSDYAQLQWLQQGFVNANGTLEKGSTPRNLFGQVDGTVNPQTPEDFSEQVWIESGKFQDGTAMVVRRISMNMDTWDEVDRASREAAVGRDLKEGAPLSGEKERDPVDLEARDKYGLRKIDPTSHVARAHHKTQKILRRPYNYDQPPSPGSESMSETGQVFICFQQNPREQFEPIQARLDEADLMNTWLTHVGSAMYFIPRGTTADGSGDSYWGESLLRG